MPKPGLPAFSALRLGGGIRHGDGRNNDSSRLSRPLSSVGGSALRSSDARVGGGVSSPGAEDEAERALSGGGGLAPGGGRADGHALGAASGQAHIEGPRFNVEVPPRGYRWWYVDALSDDGRFGLTVIAFIGSVFSPYYHWSGRRDPHNHCAMNVALYGPTRNRWSMTERRRTTLLQEEHSISIGPSDMTWDGEELLIRFDEITAPIPSRIRGNVRLKPAALVDQTYQLSPVGDHLWSPIAPRAAVEVTLDEPDCRWRGDGYFDTNAGAAPLETAFSAWHWSRAHHDRETLLFYDVERLGLDPLHLGLKVGLDGSVEHVPSPPVIALPKTGWGMRRSVRAPEGESIQVRRTLEDAPFYARSALIGGIAGAPTPIVHESISLDRLRSPVVRAMLPFRMPRVFW